MLEQNKEKLSASQEDYLEAIFNLFNTGAVVRSKDIAKSLEVGMSSVTGALRSLGEKKLINYKPYEYITLTDSGQKVAALIAKSMMLSSRSLLMFLESMQTKRKRQHVVRNTHWGKRSLIDC